MTWLTTSTHIPGICPDLLVSLTSLLPKGWVTALPVHPFIQQTCRAPNPCRGARPANLGLGRYSVPPDWVSRPQPVLLFGAWDPAHTMGTQTPELGTTKLPWVRAGFVVKVRECSASARTCPPPSLHDGGPVV